MEHEFFGLPLIYYLALVAKVIVVFVFMIFTVAYATYAERKIIGRIQIRHGPMITGWHGIIQPIADGIKLFFKEEIVQFQASKLIFFLAPFMALVPAYAAFAVIPFGDVIEVGGYNSRLL